MSNDIQLQPVLKTAIAASKTRFEGTALTYESEKVFAYDALTKNDKLAEVAMRNPETLKLAMYNAAAVGLTLNPARKFAYLITRKLNGAVRVILDISYKGLIEIAIKTGSIKSCSVTLLHEKDLETFQWIDDFTPPKFAPNPFSKDRGEIIGGYCQARLSDGSFLLSAMTIEQILKRRDSSPAGNSQYGPWSNWYEEMCMKTIVKNAARFWPTNGVASFDEAQRVLNEDNGEGLTNEARKTVNTDSSVIDGEVVAEQPQTLEQQLSALPEVPDAENVPEKVRNWVAKMVQAAVQRKAFDTAVGTFKERLQGEHLAYALDQLNREQLTTTAA